MPVSILAGFINRVSTLPKKMVELEMINLSPTLVKNIESFGNIIFWVVVVIFAGWVLGKFITNINSLRGEDEQEVSPVLAKRRHNMLVRNKKPFSMGVVLPFRSLPYCCLYFLRFSVEKTAWCLLIAALTNCQRVLHILSPRLQKEVDKYVGKPCLQ